MLKENVSLIKKIKRKRKKLSPIQYVVVGFVLLIAAGTLFLSLPISSRARTFTPISNAAFTATSAACVTGLSVYDTMTHWSLFGKIVILTLIQIGGLGVMSMAVLWALLLKRSLSPRENLIVSRSLGLSGSNDAATRLMKIIVCGTFSFELVGAIVLSFRFIPLFGVREGIFKSVFHSVSAFCNAGFDIMGGYHKGSSLSAFSSDPLVLITVSCLVIIGGVGFIVWADVFTALTVKLKGKNKVSRTGTWLITESASRLSAYSKFVILLTVVLLIFGMCVTLVCEWNGVLADMKLGDKLLNAFFHSVSLRTAGFSSFDNGKASVPVKVMSVLWMFTGGASGSTAGGVKVSTIGIFIYSVFVIMTTGKNKVVIFKRRIKEEMILRTMAIVITGGAIIFAASSLLVFVGDLTPMQALYESVSAYATVGLTLGVTAGLNLFCKVIIMLLMFLGRVGILTVLLSLASKSARSKDFIDYPEAHFMIG